jgi:hypothetical protein
MAGGVTMADAVKPPPKILPMDGSHESDMDPPMGKLEFAGYDERTMNNRRR